MAPDEQDVIDYFRWRQADAARCALNGWCYWQLMKEGATAEQATRELHGKPAALKNELLFQRGVNFNDVPLWQRRGTGVLWEAFDKVGTNPRTQEATVAVRRRIARDEALPLNDEYDTFLRQVIADAAQWSGRARPGR